MALTAGTRIGPYEVKTLIDAGGMGEVYRAVDTVLGRQVAVKVLPDEFAADAGRLARFEREARALASLNHPHIAQVYGFEKSGQTHALVMELVEGPTLAEVLAGSRGPGLRVDEALAVAGQIAEALEAAHEQGIIHRDLKPANIKIRPDGTVKVLDFGLAKAVNPTAVSSVDVSQAPTVTVPPRTLAGVILGTAAYMSPEQALGKPVDTRTDVWAFGCVLYEILTGRPVFQGDAVLGVLAHVLEREPDLTRLPLQTPPAIRRLLQRALTKDVQQRLRHIGDARLDIAEAAAGKGDAPQPGGATPRRVMWLTASLALALAIALGLAVMFAFRNAAAGSSLVARFSFWSPTPGAEANATSLSISPDGQHIAFVAAAPTGATSIVFIRSLDSLDATPVTGTEGATGPPFWSPDGAQLGFAASGKLKRVAAGGGPPQDLADIVQFRGGTWSRTGGILFGDGDSGLRAVTASGQNAIVVTAPDPGRGEIAHAWPVFLEDGRRFLYFSFNRQRGASAIHAGSLDSPERTELLRVASMPVAVSSGYVLYHRDGTVMAQALDRDRTRLVGEPVSVLQNVAFRPELGGSRAAFAVSDSGNIVYRAGDSSFVSRLAWYDRMGGRLREIGLPAGAYRGVSVSPDGSRIAIHKHEERGGDIWIWDDGRSTLTRVTDNGAHNVTPVWTPDGRAVTYAADDGTGNVIYRKDVLEVGEEERLTAPGFPEDWSPDGRTLIYATAFPERGLDILQFLIGGGQDARPLVSTRYIDAQAKVSPDGRWLAYFSQRSGRGEIHVQGFPTSGRTHQISTAGGLWPHWTRDGRELFWLGVDNTLMVASVDVAGGSLNAGVPRALFQASFMVGRHGAGGSAYAPFDISVDGERILVIEDPSDDLRPTPLTVVVNWQRDLAQLVGN